MPKIAVLISGEYRTFGMCRKTMPFLDDPRVDIYFSTWNKTRYFVPKIAYIREEEVTLQRIQTALDRTAIIDIEPFDLIKETRYNSKMIHRWKRGLDLINQSGNRYDYIMITRPDIFFNNQYPAILHDVEKYKNSLGICWSQSLHLGRMTDVIMLSSTEIINKVFDPLKISVWETAKEADWHKWWYNHVMSIYNNVVDMPELNHFVFCRAWSKPDHTFSEVLMAKLDWRDLILLGQVDSLGREFANELWPATVLPEAEKKWNNGHFDKYK